MDSCDDALARPADSSPPQKVGGGTFGSVFRTRGHILKRMHNYGDVDASMLLRELAVLEHLRSPHLVRGRGARMEAGALVFCMEDGGNDLKALLHLRTIRGDDVLMLMRQLLLGVQHLHEQGILHCDLKPANIVLKDGCLKVADFGMATDERCRPQEPHVVTRWYRAPELELLPSEAPYGGTYSFPVDMWSVGCILGEMLLSAYEKLAAPLFQSSHSAFTPDARGARQSAAERSHLCVTVSVLVALYEEQELDTSTLKQQWDHMDMPPTAWDRKYLRSLKHAPPASVQTLLLPLLLPWPEARMTAEQALDQLETLDTSFAPRPSSPPASPQFRQWMGMSNEHAQQMLQVVVPGMYSL